MIIVDTAIARHVAAGKPPIRVGMIGAGFMASGVVLQTGGPYRDFDPHRRHRRAHPVEGCRRLRGGGLRGPGDGRQRAGLARAIEAGRPAVTEDAMLVATSPHVDVLLDVTGAVEDAIAPVLAAIEHGKHVLLMNPELDGTLGPLFKHKADKAGVVFTDVDGDQPGVIGNLHRFVKGLGVRPVLLGNIKGLQDPYRNPTTQKGFAEKLGAEPLPRHLLRRRHQGQLRDDGGRQRHRHDRGQARHARLHLRPRHPDHPGGEALRRRRDPRRPRHRRLRGRLRARARASGRSAPSSTRASATTSTSTSSARGRSTASTPPTTSATSRCR